MPITRSPSARQFCRDALAIVARLFRLWYRFRGDLRDRRGNPQPIDRQQLIDKSIPLQKRLFALAQVHLDDTDREVRNLATALFIHFHRLFPFLEEKGVEPTNNVAERMLRTAVQWRKISFGNRSRHGEIATARLLTVTQTCKRQQRHVLGYLTAAVRCHRRRIASPSLLPQRPGPPEVLGTVADILRAAAPAQSGSRTSFSNEASLLRQLERLETVQDRQESNHRLKIEFAYLKQLPREHSGPDTS